MENLHAISPDIQEVINISESKNLSVQEVRRVFELWKTTVPNAPIIFAGTDFDLFAKIASIAEIKHTDILEFAEGGIQFTLKDFEYDDLLIETSSQGEGLSKARIKYADVFRQGGMVITQVNYKKGDAMSEVRAENFLSMVINAYRYGVRLYVINDGLDDYWRGRLEEVISSYRRDDRSKYLMLVDYSEKQYQDLPFAQRRQLAVERALEDPSVKYIYWTEAEKPDLLQIGNLARVGAAILDGNQILIPTPKPKDNRPRYMQTMELVSERVLEYLLKNTDSIRANNGELPPVSDFLKEYGGSKGITAQPDNPRAHYDYYFGPFVVEREVAKEYFTGDPHWKNWDYNVLAKAIAHHEGITTASVPVVFSYPEQQKDYEESQIIKMISYRLMQSRAITASAIHKIRNVNPQ